MLCYDLNVNLLNKQLIFIFLNISMYIIYSSQYKCGIPGHTLKSSIKTALNNDKVVENEIKIKYSCDYNDAPFLIGHNERQCIDGEWDQKMPKCASLYTGKYEMEFTPNGNAINISLATLTRISGIVVKVSSLEPIQVVNIKNIPSPECFIANSTFKEKVPFHLTKRYSTLFHCPTKDISVASNMRVQWILITFSEKFKNCELISCPAILEFVELYESHDECFRPDVPAFGKLTSVKTNQTVIKFNYQCDDFFAMETNQISKIPLVCSPNEEWPQKLPKCIPTIKCELENNEELKVTYNWLWSETEAVVGTIATFECQQNSTKINGTLKRECRSDGNWSEELPNCITVTTSQIPTLVTTESTTESVISSTNTMAFTIEEPTDFMILSTLRPQSVPKSVISLTTERVYYPSHRETTTTTPLFQPKSDQSSDSLQFINLIYIFLGLLMGILITICVIYYFHKKNRKSNNSGRDKKLRPALNNRTAKNEVYYDHINPNISETRDPCLSNPCLDSESSDSNPIQNSVYPYDSAGYIQIEAVESMRMNTFKKYENFENNRKYTKPLPQIPKY